MSGGFGGDAGSFFLHGGISGILNRWFVDDDGVPKLPVDALPGITSRLTRSYGFDRPEEPSTITDIRRDVIRVGFKFSEISCVTSCAGTDIRRFGGNGFSIGGGISVLPNCFHAFGIVSWRWLSSISPCRIVIGSA